MKIIICTIKSWNIELAIELKEKLEHFHEVFIITNQEELDFNKVKEIKPDYIFFPHWSFIIPSEIFENFDCIVFHMTDLPFGRGGSPLQNLLVRGIYKTRISALKVNRGIDEGPIYLKHDFDISSGTAEEIYRSISNIVFTNMIPFILETSPIPKKQTGKVVEFKRRQENDGEIRSEFSIEKINDFIRMLDAESYPKAFISFGDYKLLLSDANLNNGQLTAKIEFHKIGSESNE